MTQHMAKVYGAGVLAGAYRARGLERTLLTHAVSDSAIANGRLKREPGEAFCKKGIDLVDSGGWGSADSINCPACLSILARFA